MTNNGHDNSFGAGINLGFGLPLAEKIALGGGVRSRVYMSKLDYYQGLFAEQGAFDIPASALLALPGKQRRV